MGRAGPLAALASALLALAPAQTGAQEPGHVLVAGPTAETGQRLEARAAGKDLCLSISSRSGSTGSCTEIADRDLREPFHTSLVAANERTGPLIAAGAVRANVEAVELELSRQRSLTLAPAPPKTPLERPAGALRYYVAELPADAQIYSTRLLGAGGEPLAEFDASSEPGGDARPPLQGPFRLARARGEGRRWTVSATIESRLHAVRGDVLHRERVLCLQTRAYERDGSQAAGEQCLTERQEATTDVLLSCAQRGRHMVYGIARPADVPRAVVLTTGARVPVRRVALPAEFGRGDATGWVAVARRGAGVRSLLPAAGDPSPSFAIDVPPPSLMPCGAFGIFTDHPTGDDPPEPGPGGDVDVAAPGAPPLFVRDGDGRELCLAPQRPAFAHECSTPGPWLVDTLLERTADRRAVGGAVDPRITTVRIRLDDRSTFDVPTHPGSAYTGRYAGQLAFFSAAAPPGRHVTAVDLLDERGRPLEGSSFFTPFLATDAAPLLRSNGITVAAARYEPSRLGNRSCVIVVDGPLPAAGQECEHDLAPDVHVLTGLVSCTPRRATLLVGLSRQAKAAVARLSDGSRRRFKIRRTPTGERIGVLVLPPGAGVRGVTTRSGRGAVLRRFRAPMPRAAAHCGYAFWVFQEIERPTRRGAARAAARRP